MNEALMFTLMLPLLVLVILYMGVKFVPQSTEWTVERFGRFTHVLSPGLNFIIPFIDRIGEKVSMREHVIDVPSQDIITRDNAMVRVDGVVFFQVIDSVKAAYEVEDLTHAMINLTMTNTRTVMGAMDLDELLSNRERINTELLHVVDEATNHWGVKVTRIEIKDINPPKDLVDAMGRQMKAEREKRAFILEAQGVRESEILKAEGEKQAAILKAEGLKEAAFREAEARERQAQAEAEATRMVSTAIDKGNLQAVNYFVALKYVDALRDIASADNQKVLFMPLEASNVIGALGGITEIAQQAFSSKANPITKK